MAVSEGFLANMIDQPLAWGGVTSKRMFGGVGLFHDGKMFGLVFDNIAYLKVDETNRGKYIEAGSVPFKPYPDRPTMKSYFEIPPDILEGSEELIEWAEESLLIQKARK